jgi:hypothetical protein
MPYEYNSVYCHAVHLRPHCNLNGDESQGFHLRSARDEAFDNALKGCYDSPARQAWVLREPVRKGNLWPTVWLVHDELVPQSARLPAKDLRPVDRRHLAYAALLLHRGAALDPRSSPSGSCYTITVPHMDAKPTAEPAAHGHLDRKPDKHHPYSHGRDAHTNRNTAAGRKRHVHTHTNKHSYAYTVFYPDENTHAHTDGDGYEYSYGYTHQNCHSYGDGHSNSYQYVLADQYTFANRHAHAHANLYEHADRYADLHADSFSDANDDSHRDHHPYLYADLHPQPIVEEGSR